LVEQWTENPRVDSSILSLATIYFKHPLIFVLQLSFLESFDGYLSQKKQQMASPYSTTQ